MEHSGLTRRNYGCTSLWISVSLWKWNKQRQKSPPQSHVWLEENYRKDREDLINGFFLKMSFLFSSGMLQASHSSQACMIQWQLIHPWCRYTTSIQTLFMQLQRTGWLPSWIRQWGICEPSINMTSPLKITLVPCPLGSWSSKTNITLRPGAPGPEVLSVTSTGTETEGSALFRGFGYRNHLDQHYA